MTDHKYDNETQRWRDKYLSISEELDKNEKDYASYLNVLHRALVRISLAADGQDNELDKHLANLRDLLRKQPVNQSSINSNLSQVESAILQLDKQRKDNGQQGFNSLQALIDQLLQLKLGKDKQRALKRYSKSLTDKGNQLSSYPALLEEYSRLQRDALAEALNTATESKTSAAQSSGGGLFSRMFGGKSDTTPTDTESSTNTNDKEATTPEAHIAIGGVATDSEEPAPSSDPAQQETDTTLEKVTLPADVSSQDSDEESDTLATVTKILADLLEQLPLVPDVRDQAEQLRDHLSDLAAAGEWEQMIDGTAELVIKALDKSQQEFEQFLLTLDQQLSQITNYLGSQGQNKEARKDSTQQLNAMVRDQVGSISQAVGEASDISDLKISVQNQLKTIITSMDEFVETETQREQALEQQLQEMHEQLTLAQTESQSIRKKLQNETLRALTDTLTGIPNREAFDERFILERERFLRYKHPASLAILDIDHFKLVNDNHGHLVGDRVLQAFAATIKKMIRSTDFLARFGGEEFILIMPETDANAAHVLLEKIREGIAQMPPKNLGTQNSITVSGGLAAFQLGEKAEQLVERADQALYLAKNEGRNRIAVAASAG
jgi:diguanylate cyclase